jgi:hypothetical protein
MNKLSNNLKPILNKGIDSKFYPRDPTFNNIILGFLAATYRTQNKTYKLQEDESPFVLCINFGQNQ